MVEKKKYIQHIHHENEVFVREDLAGKHREYCMCYDCAKFSPDNPGTHCRIANMVYALDRLYDVTTPVFECMEFEQTKEENEE